MMAPFTRAMIGALAILLALASPAAAHSELRRTNPASNAVLDASPAEIVVEFNERVQVTTLRLVDSAGRQTRLPTTTLRAAASIERVALTAPLAPGRWQIEWAAISADGHPISGRVFFEVRTRQ